MSSHDDERLPLQLPALRFEIGTSWGQEARSYLQEARTQLHDHHLRGTSGHAIVEAYTATMDELIRALFVAGDAAYTERYSRLNQQCAVVAQGGYGRGELNPCSDIDLLFLFQHKIDPYIESIVERILYALYDTRVEVGHAVRNVRECVRMAAQDLKVKTALLDTRFLCGDEGLYSEFAEAMDRDVLKRNAARFFKDKLAESEARHNQYGDSVYLLEPHLKDGEGGLRDLHTAMWLAKVKFKTNKSGALVRLGVITDTERDELEAARDFLFRVRNSLHFLSGKHQDRLTFEYQEACAPELGFQDTPTRKAVEQFMQTYYLHAATINRFSAEIIERCQERAQPYRLLGRFTTRSIRPGVSISSGILSISGKELLDEDPTNLIRVFSDAQRHNTEISNATKRLIRANLHQMDDETRASPEMVAAFFEVLRGKQEVYETLLEMHRVGVLGAFLPEFGHLTCMVLHDLYHTYTVDEHSLRGVREMERLRAGQHQSIAPLLTQVMREVDRVEILFLSMILHDIGKGHGSKHSERGAAMIDAIATRLNLNTDDAEQLKFLVLHHLTMSHLAQRRDIHDQRLLIDFAKRVETLDNLKKLYLLTFADMRAVGPKIWNNWHDMLLGELYQQTFDIFESETFVEDDQADRLQRVRTRVVSAAAHVVRAVREAFLAEMPDRYLLATNEETIVHHMELVSRLADGEPFFAEVKHYPERAFSELTVLTKDRPGLFAMLTGVLLAHGMNILTASINTSSRGMALDIFRVSHGDSPESAQRPERWERMIVSLGLVLTDQADVEQIVAKSERAGYVPKRYVPRTPTEVDVDNDVSGNFTVLDVYTQDRVGVLFAITNTLFHLGLSIHIAKITTNVDQVLDVFYVTDPQGKKITEETQIEAIRAELLTRLAPSGDEPPAPHLESSMTI